jgi:NAD-dependent SIR2 family protein deacetylase
MDCPLPSRRPIIVCVVDGSRALGAVGEDETALDLAADHLRSARRLVVLTGSGVSAESGIPTFRDEGGFWERYPPERFASLDGLLGTLLLEPRLLVEFAGEVIGPIARARPNAAHRAIAWLERHTLATVVTQNIDGLHQEAGSAGVREIHGSLLEISDRHGMPIRRITRAELLTMAEAVERAAAGSWPLIRGAAALRPLLGLSRHGVHRPHVVFFGEALRQPDWDDALRGAELCEAMLVVGTSALVMPAAALPQIARAHGAPVILVDPVAHTRADVHLSGRAADVLPSLVGRAFER